MTAPLSPPPARDRRATPASPWPMLAALALLIGGLHFIETLLSARLVFSDWHAYHRAANNLVTNQDIYAEGKLLLERNSYDYWVHTDGQYVYPPLLALLVTPLALATDIGKGGDYWLLALALAFFGALATMLALSRRAPRLEHIALIGLPLLFAVPLELSLRYGQVDLLLLLLLCLSLLAFTRRRDALAGVALGLAAAIKPLFVLYAVFYLRKGRWLTLASAGVTGLLTGLLPFALLPSANFFDWLAISRYFSGEDYPSYPSNQSARGLLLRAFAGGPRHAPLLDQLWLANALWLACLVVVAGLIWFFISGRAGREGRAVEEFALLVTLVLFAAPLSEDIHYVLVLLPLAVLVDRAARGGMPGWWVALVLAACFYYLQPWLDFAYNRGGTDARRLIASGAYLYGLLPIGAALLIRLGWWSPAGSSARDEATMEPSSLRAPVSLARDATSAEGGEP